MKNEQLYDLWPFSKGGYGTDKDGERIIREGKVPDEIALLTPYDVLDGLNSKVRIENLAATKTLVEIERKADFPLLRIIKKHIREGNIPYFVWNLRGMGGCSLWMGNRGDPVVDPVHEENKDSITELFENSERAIVFGDSRTGLFPHYNGIIRQLENSCPENIMNLGNDYMNFSVFDDIAETFAESFAKKRQKFKDVVALVTPNTHKALAELCRGYCRDFSYGRPQFHATQFGEPITFESSILLEAVDGSRPMDEKFPADHFAPPMPTTVDVKTYVEINGSQFGMYDDVRYWVSSVGHLAESYAIPSAPVGVTTNRCAVISVHTDPSAVAVRIYREDAFKKDNTSQSSSYIATVPVVKGVASFTDRNEWVPNTDIALVFQKDALAITENGSLLKIPKDITSTTIEFVTAYPHKFTLLNPEHCVVIKNIRKLKDF